MAPIINDHDQKIPLQFQVDAGLSREIRNFRLSNSRGHSPHLVPRLILEHIVHQRGRGQRGPHADIRIRLGQDTKGLFQRESQRSQSRGTDEQHLQLLGGVVSSSFLPLGAHHGIPFLFPRGSRGFGAFSSVWQRAVCSHFPSFREIFVFRPPQFPPSLFFPWFFLLPDHLVSRGWPTKGMNSRCLRDLL